MKVLEDVDRAQESKTAIAEKAWHPEVHPFEDFERSRKDSKAYNSGAFTPGRKRMRLADHEDLEKALFLWFKRALKLQPSTSGCKPEGSDASQEESDADNAEADTVFDLVAQRCGSGTGTMDEYEAVDDDVVTCREDTLVDILKEVEEGTGNESEEEMDSDDHQSAPLTSEASQAVELLQRYFQKEGCLEHLCNLNKMNAYLVKQSHTKLKQATLHSFFGGCDP
ncbi:hypothetical protein HPB49_021032 [Dermacentor silvarum]|uniref:Uncharacterized protein n=1 Tax=Dermacentor silvarum TaxID=543639 RepID=A0ACB8DQF0_DERSI|nr:hypothetical protein HPB49_021032 [Dermacentor silvarum]